MTNKPKHPYGIWIHRLIGWTIYYTIYAYDEVGNCSAVKGDIKLWKVDVRSDENTSRHYVFLSKKTINTDIARFEKETGTKHVSFEYHDNDFNLKQRKL